METAGAGVAPRQAAVAPRFVPVRVEEYGAPVAGGGIVVELANGWRVHVTAPVDGQALTDVLAVLEGRPC